MHPWLFMGALSKGKGNCEPSEMFSFGSVKDLGPSQALVTANVGPTCEYAVAQKDASAQWTATCPLEIRGHTFESRRELIVAIEAQRNEEAEGWMHDAVFAKQVRGAGADGNCLYVGRVVHRDAQR